ncbi:Heterokaryon incompatibility protein (HET) domain containing protein [Rhypophila sp. PSN 637]
MALEKLCSQNREIRVAILYPRDHTSPALSPSNPLASTGIQISLRKVSLGDSPPPQYTALSYVWGNPGETIPILVNDVEFLATKNLVAAWTELRPEDGDPMTLWIDTVCINQSDNDEKTGQIQLMKQIYEASFLTIVWLDDDADGSEAVMKMWSEFAVRPEVQAVFEQSKTANIATRPVYSHGQLSSGLIIDSGVPHSFAQQGVLVQGLVFAGDIRAKEHNDCLWERGSRIDADAFGKIIRYYIDLMVIITSMGVIRNPDLLELIKTESPYLSGNVVSSVNGAIMMLDQRTRNREILGHHEPSDESEHEHHGEEERSDGPCHPKLLDYLIEAYASKRHKVSLRSTDPRDMIYGLLNLASDVEELGVVPNYEKTCEQVFTETWAAILRRHGADSPSSSIGPNEIAVPSWVPDWRQPHPFHVLHQSGLFLACGPKNQQTQWAPTEDPRGIALRGVQIDIVREIGTPLDGHNGQQVSSLAMLVNEVTQFLEKSSLLAPSPEESVYPTPEANHSARWRIPLCDLDGTSKLFMRSSMKRATSASEESFTSALAVIEGLRQATAPGVANGAENWSITLGQHLQEVIAYSSTVFLASCSRPFLTSHGWVGRGPAEMRPGDVVVILWGCWLPIVLRPCGGDADDLKYQLVGDAYVHGLMDGEYVQGDVEREERTFQLC